MNNPNPKLRYALGISALTALSLAMVGCGGSSSSAPAAAVNASPTAPIVAFSGGQQITGHPSFYTLTSTDPEGDVITYSVTGTGTSVTGNTVTLNTATAGTATFAATATDSHGNHSAATNQSVVIAANRAPQFISQANGQLTGTSSAIAWNTFQVVSQDPDGDDVRYAVTGAATFADNNGGTSGIGGAITINPVTGVVSFTGTVPSGATSVTATFTVTATDQLVGSGTVLGATSSQVINLTFFSNNLAPVVLTSSLPNLPLNHYIPTVQGGSGFALTANDPDGATQTNALVWTMTSSTPGVVLSSSPTSLSSGPVIGATAYIMTNSAFVPLTSSSQSITVTVTVTDPGGLTSTRTLTISPVADSVPTLNSNVYTETVSGVVAFDSSRVKNDITGPTRSKFYPGDIDWVGFGQYAGNNYIGALESTGGIDAAATDNAFSNYLNAYPGGFLGALIDQTQPAKGWNARTIFRDPEGDAVTYSLLPGSVFVAGTPWNVVGQTFTLSPVTLPSIPGGIYPGINPDLSEYPMVDANTGTIQWRPIATSEIAFGNPVGGTPPFLLPLSDNLGFDVWSQPSVWSFIVQANENVYVPPGNTAVTAPSNQGQQQYVIKVQPNNAPTIGPLTTIPNAQLTVPGALANQVVNPLTTISIGGGASSSATAYGRPSIQEPESKRYSQASGTGFDYAAPNTTKPAIWRWLMAMPGGDFTEAADVQIYDGDQTTVTGHQDTIFATMGTPTVPAADTTNNVPALVAGSASFYNPWLTAGNAGAFQVNWGPNRTQYLIARVTASAAYAFPVEVRDQYERINNGNLNINPIFGTVRFTNARTRVVGDAPAEMWALNRGGTLLSGANPGDPSIGASHFTFTYLPFPADSGSGNETNFGTFFFQGSGPASGVSNGAAPPNLYTAASWITLNAREAPYTSYHTGNPLNDEAGTFNLPAYASAYQGTSSSSSRADWKTYGYTYVNGSNPTDPAVEDRDAVGSYANHEVRAQVIPSNSPYLFTFSTTLIDGPFIGTGPLNSFPNELMSSTTQMPLQNVFSPSLPASVGPTGAWYDLPVLNGGSGGGGIGALAPAFAHSWVYNLYQGEVDMQNAAPGRGVTLADSYRVSQTTLRWAYSWPTQVTNSNLGVATGGTNKWEKGDVMQIAVPNHRANARYFFVGDGSINDPNASHIYNWGFLGISGALDVGPADTVFGTSTISGGAIGSADNTPFHVPSNSLWLSNNIFGGVSTGFLNTPNRTTFSPGSTSTQVPFGYASRGYIAESIAGGFGNVDPGYMWSISDSNFPNGAQVAPGLIDLSQGDNTYFLWLKHDTKVPTAWGTWDASELVSGSTYTAVGGTTTTPGFNSVGGGMANATNNSTLPASYLQDAQISMATSFSPGQNHAANVNVKTDPALYNANITSPKGWARSQWGLTAPTMGYQPLGSTNVRLVNPKFDSAVTTAPGHGWNHARGQFHTTTVADVSVEGGVRDSAIVYGVRRRTNENGVANAELGLAGIEPGSPLLAQWYNIQTSTDIALNESTVASTNMTDIGAGWPAVFNFYSPFSGNAAWANVMEYKVNFLVGVTYPDANVADPGNTSLNTLWKVPAQMANVFPLGEALTDPSNNNPDGSHTIDPGNPIIRPIQTLRITDFTANTTPGTFNTTLDLVTSSPTNATSGAGAMVLAGTSYIQARSNVKVTFQASVNNQVVPSGYIFDLFLLNGTATTTAQPVLLASVRTGHIGGKDAIQNLFLPSMHSYSGLDGGGVNGVPPTNNAVYFFRIRTVWNKGINFEKQPNKQSIPMAYADYISAPFVTN